MRVRDAMTSEGLVTASLDTTLEEIACLMKTENIGCIPILDEEDAVVGVVTDRDIIVRGIAEGRSAAESTAEEIVSDNLHTVAPDAELQSAVARMARHKVRRLPVVKDGILVGIIALADILSKSPAMPLKKSSSKSKRLDIGQTLKAISEGVRQTQARAKDAHEETKYRGDELEAAELEFEEVHEFSPESRILHERASVRGRQSSSIRGRYAGDEIDEIQDAQAHGIMSRVSESAARRQAKIIPMPARGARVTQALANPADPANPSNPENPSHKDHKRKRTG